MVANTRLDPLSPLADPVVGAIFSDAEHAGKAAASLVGAVLEQDGLAIGTVLSVTPQRYLKYPGERGVRVDIEVTTVSNENTIVEVQLYTDPSLLQRNLFAASRVFVDKVPEGAKPESLVKTMPRVIAIDILDYNLRDDNTDYLQPIKLLYTKPPHREALGQFSIYALQLPRVREGKADFDDRLYCWLYAFDTAHQQKKTMEEVLEMTPELKTFAKRDAGFLQYCERYNRVAAEPETRDEYFRWVNEQWRQAGMKQAAEEEGMAKGMAQGMAKGIAEGMAQGIAEGMAQGRAEGMAKGMAKGMAQGMAQGMAKGMAQGMAEGMAERDALKATNKALETEVAELRRRLAEAGR